ncbi:MAG TPA: alpha/beta hydrolase [Edaphobacter sp.]|jgi:haloalkane dehalogenase|nr:alpha/beta hydrolase [Edaphobacter sp.]
MTRRDFLYGSSAVASATFLPENNGHPRPSDTKLVDAKSFQASRKFASLSMGRIAYIERGHGLAALFVHGYPLNGFQWRGVFDELQGHRRCIAPDAMGLGYTETPEGQEISPGTQVEMLALLLDSLQIDTVDLVGNDSGGLVSQLFVAKYPHRVRTLLLTNCDVDEDNPPASFLPLIELAKNGTLADRFVVSQLSDKQLARSERGLGGAYSYPEKLSDETIEVYLRPLVATPLRKSQLNRYTVSLGVNELVAVREDLRRWRGPARIVWGLKDTIFSVASAEWLDRTLPGSRGVRRIAGANLFFPEEMPDVIAEEALALWGIAPLPPKQQATVSSKALWDI